MLEPATAALSCFALSTAIRRGEKCRPLLELGGTATILYMLTYR